MVRPAQETPMDLHLCYNASEDTFPLPLHIKQLHGPFGFPTRSDTERPYRRRTDILRMSQPDDETWPFGKQLPMVPINSLLA